MERGGQAFVVGYLKLTSPSVSDVFVERLEVLSLEMNIHMICCICNVVGLVI